MRNRKKGIIKRVFAAFLATMIAFTGTGNMAMVSAATETHPDAITISVVDEEGVAVENASVAITVNSIANGDNYISDTKTTDEMGVVEVMPSDDYVADDFTISATVSAVGYTQGTLELTPIESASDDYQIVVTSTLIKDVTIEGKNLTYTGEAQELVSVTEIEGDTVTYEVDGGEASTDKPERTDAGTYSVKVTVSRENKDDLVEIVSTTIAPKDIEDINLEGKNLTYNEEEQELVIFTGWEEGDIITWIVNTQPTDSDDIPKKMEVGEYSVTVNVDRGSNYNVYTNTVNSIISCDELVLGDIVITGINEEYTGGEMEALSVTKPEGATYTLKYQLDDGDGIIDDGAWEENIPKVTMPGEYVVWVKAVKYGYFDKIVSEIPYSAYITKKEQKLEFAVEEYENALNAIVSFTVNEDVPFSNEYDFTVNVLEGNVDDSIVYSVNQHCDACSEDADIATIDAATGALTVTHPGVVEVVATLAGNDIYEDCEISRTVQFSMDEEAQKTYIYFAEKNINYVVGTNSGIASQNQPITLEKDNGAITYSITNGTGLGLHVDGNGKVTVSDYKVLLDALYGANGTLAVEVKADKAKDADCLGGTKYPSDYDTYTINISFHETPETPTTIEGECNANGWYKDAITVKPANNYTVVTKDGLNSAADNFTDTVMFADQGNTERYVYLRNTNGGITAPIKVQEALIDTIAPDANNMSVEIEELNIIQKLGTQFRFFNSDVEIKFTIVDETGENESGVDYIEWFYKKDASATSSILGDSAGERVEVTKDGDKYVATYTVTPTEAEQYRGNFSFVAYDKAGNCSDVVQDNDSSVVVVDTITPQIFVDYEGVRQDEIIDDAGKVIQKYYKGDVDFNLVVKEANFFEENVVINVLKNGVKQDREFVWTQDVADDETYVTAFTLSGDGDYVVEVIYEDYSKNGSEIIVNNDTDTDTKVSWTSEVITIDNIAPEVLIEHDATAENQVTTFTVKEKNFNPQHVAISASVSDSTDGNIAEEAAEYLDALLKQGEWTAASEDTYTYQYNGYDDGHYQFKLDYEDYCGWQAVTSESEEFMVDHTGPTDIEITYSTSIFEKIKEIVTFRYYNPSVVVTFAAKDNVSGVEKFEWKYTKQPEASTIAHSESVTDTEPLEVTRIEGDKYIAEMTLTADEFSQYRGYISVLATDKFNNQSNDGNMVDDSNNIIVIDTIEPQIDDIKVVYPVSAFNETIEDRTVYYYNGEITVEIIITEANFDPEFVEVYVAKDGEEYLATNVEWGERDAEDKTVGRIALGGAANHLGDGQYVLKVVYKDYLFAEEGQEYKEYIYESDVHVVDTTSPEITVKYSNSAAINNITDSDGNSRKYYADTQTATVTINEKNFDSQKVEFKIEARTIDGTVLDAGGLHSKSSWSSNDKKDTHTMTISFPGDANYMFSVACVDKATNAAKDYPADYFTVDKTNPVNVSINYSASLLDVVLEAVSFGFYNSPVKVTVSAEDSISGVNSFEYSYIKAQGVSDVNAELIANEIAKSDIQYSSGGKNASASFEIPRGSLSNASQFNGIVEVLAKDTSGNKTDVFRSEKRLVVDNIAPTAQISYNEPSNVFENISYYDGDINATITINEANFYSEDVVVTVTKDGNATTEITPIWRDDSVDVHVGTFTLTEDGDYVVNVQYADKSTNSMEAYTSEQMTIDTQLELPVIKINGVEKTDIGGAYKGDVEIEFNFEDVNYDTSEIRLIKTSFDKVEDVTERFIKIVERSNGGSGSFVIPSTVDNDGIYVMTVGITDKALHNEEVEVKYTVNRFGSVYEYDNALIELIKDGGQYVKEVDKDLVITEYNADKLIKDSLKILITRDGETIDAKYTSNPKDIDADVTAEDGAWYKYVYTIDESNFEVDGVYKISLSSEYFADDSEKNESASVPENSMDKNGNRILDTMTFTVDSTAPEIRNIVNLEEAIVNQTELEVKYTVVDVGGLDSVEVILNGESVEKITEFGDSIYSYSGAFIISESADSQTIQLKIMDLAGNVTDTAREDFSTNDLYIFNDKVTVSTNVFVRWYADKTVFWGTVGGMVFLSGAAGSVGVFVGKRRRLKV